MATIQPIANDDHIVKIQPAEDVILALDADGNELCRFEFEVAGKKVRFRTPVINKHPKFALKLAELFTYLSQHAGKLSMTNSDETEPDLIKLFKNPDHNSIWTKLSAIAVTARPIVTELIYDIFFNYLDGDIIGLEFEFPMIRYKLLFKRKMTTDEKDNYIYEQKKKWFADNARIDEIQRVFSACLAVDDMVKKNARFVLAKEILNSPNSRVQNIEDISARKPGSTLSGSTPTPSYSFEQL